MQDQPMKKPSLSTKSRLIPCILGVTAVLILLVGATTIFSLYRVIKHVENYENLSSRNFRSQVQSEIEMTTKLRNVISSSSTMNLAGVLASYLNGSKPSFSEIENNVAPYLFNVLSLTPHVTQVSYFISQGLFFSYYIDQQNQIFALYSNSSSNSRNPNSSFYWYTQMANRDNGKLFGNVIQSHPSIALTNSASWLQEALNSNWSLNSFLGSNWNNSQDLLFINTANVVKKGTLGFVSVGFSVKEVVKYYYTDFIGDQSFLVTVDGKFLAGDSQLSFDLMEANNGDQPNLSCYSNGTLSIRASHLNTKRSKYNFRCSQLDLLGLRSVYVLAIKKNGLIKFVHTYRTITLIIVVTSIAITMVLICSLIPMIRTASIREMYLSSTLMKQMNATEQAERKSFNKSHAFATASHDIRASLAGMTGLIQICYDGVASGSDLETNLRQLEGCTKDLSGMLTSILDASKIEAGKMLLEEEEFDVAQLLEDIADLYHPMGAKKGVDVILDPCDASISKFSHVKCDRVKLRQILCNLVSNAVKFTSEGQVIIRAWIRKRAMKKESIIVSNDNQSGNSDGLMQRLTCFSYKKKSENKVETTDSVENNDDPNSMELVCEVDDSGKGIPKEKRHLVFENYVQVKETALGQGGTGLGLGIVQSLVGLMHGEIGIIDKDRGEKGSCFRFTISLTICENNFCETPTKETIQSHDNHDQFTNMSNSPQLSSSPSKTEGSQVVLLIKNTERRRISEKFIRRLGIKVFSLRWTNQLPHIVKKIHRKSNNNHYSSSSNKSETGMEIVECLSKSSLSRSNSYDGLMAAEGVDYVRSLFRKTNNISDHHLLGSSSSLGLGLGCVLLIVDTTNTVGTFSELCALVNEFRNGLSNAWWCRVVWLVNPMSQSINFNSSGFDFSADIIKYKPLHGSRLYEVVRLLPEFGGPIILPNRNTNFGVSKSSPTDKPSTSRHHHHQNDDDHIVKQESEIDQEKPLTGKRFLVVDDALLNRKIAMYTIEKLGGMVDVCVNGLEAFELVCSGLINQRKLGDSSLITSTSTSPLPHYILMDCEMPVMDGYEATREIRKIEELYGVHTPIIALTAHSLGSEESNNTFKAGMDACLTRPLKEFDLMEAIDNIKSN